MRGGPRAGLRRDLVRESSGQVLRRSTVRKVQGRALVLEVPGAGVAWDSGAG